MQQIKHIISLLLIALLATSGLPLFCPEDASRDGCIDLRDAVILVQDLSGDAEQPGAFGHEFICLVKTIRTVAGLKADISLPDGPASTSGFTILKERHDHSLLPQIPTIAHRGETPFLLFASHTTYQSIILTPTPPPPESAAA